MFPFDLLLDVKDEPVMTLFDELFLKQFRGYKLEILTKVDIDFRFVVPNLEQKNLVSFKIITFLEKPDFCLFSYIYAPNSGTT